MITGVSVFSLNCIKSNVKHHVDIMALLFMYKFNKCSKRFIINSCLSTADDILLKRIPVIDNILCMEIIVEFLSVENINMLGK